MEMRLKLGRGKKLLFFDEALTGEKELKSFLISKL